METDGLIEPDVFDVIVVGTGLPEAMLAASAAASRLSVLHLDPHDFYGAHWTSLDFKQLSSWTALGGRFATPAPAPAPASGVTTGGSAEYGLSNGHGVGDSQVPISGSGEGNGTVSSSSAAAAGDRRALGALEEIELEYGESSDFSEVRVREYDSGEVSLGGRGERGGGGSRVLSSSYSIDLCGPRLTFSGSKLVNCLLRSGASHYVEFKGIDGSYIWTGREDTGLTAVPSSRADVFKDKSLSLPDKRHLMRFFKLVTDYTTSSSDGDQSTSSSGGLVDVSEEDLDGSFRDFLQRQRLPASIQSIVVYAIAFLDNDQQQREGEESSVTLKTRDGLQKLALYLSSVARFPNAPGAFIYPLYGQGELPQAFCRSAAVNGALYVLRRPVSALLVDKDSKEYKGIRTAQGQVLFSKTLIMGPSVKPSSGRSNGLSTSTGLDNRPRDNSMPAPAAAPLEGSCSQVARYVCITDRSIFEGQETLLVIFPPHSVHGSCSSVIRAVQLGSSASICPANKYIVQFSTVCNDSVHGLEALEAAVQALFESPENEGETSKAADNPAEIPFKPKLLWSLSYMQDLHTPADTLRIPGVAVCKMPDGTLDGEDMLTSTEQMFKTLFPDKDFFPQTAREDEGPDATIEDVVGEVQENSSQSREESQDGPRGSSEV